MNSKEYEELNGKINNVHIIALLAVIGVLVIIFVLIVFPLSKNEQVLCDKDIIRDNKIYGCLNVDNNKCRGEGATCIYTMKVCG